MDGWRQRDLRLDALGLATLLVSLFSLASLLSYDPADLHAEYVYPHNDVVRNWCGPVGAHLARMSTEFLGIGTLVASMVGVSLAVGCLQMRSSPTLLRNLLGGVLLVGSASALFQFTGMDSRWTPVAGPGGLAGALGASALENSVSRFGSLLLLVPLGIVAIPLAFDDHLRLCLMPVCRLSRAAWQGWRWLKSGCWVPQLAARPRRTSRAEPVSQAALAVVPETTMPEEAVAEEESEEPSESDWDSEQDQLRIVRSGFEPPNLDSPLPTRAATAISDFELPPAELLEDPEPFEYEEHELEIRERARLLEKTFLQFQMRVKVVQIDTGPVVTQYEIELEPGLRARKVIALADDLAIAMRAQSVRIVAPIPGKNTVGIEVPNQRRAKVALKEVMAKSPESTSIMRLPLYLGRDVKGQPLVCDLAEMPHLLIAGRTGTGKSVCLNALILSILMTRSPGQVKMLMIDPKMVELSLYRDIPHLLHPVVTDMKKAEALLAWAVEKMEDRYGLLARAGVRHIDSYNRLSHEERLRRLQPVDEADRAAIPGYLPYLLIFADEMADLMMTAPKEVETHIIRLAQKSRAVGIHLILATQKPTVDVITGLIKSNLPARIAFQVASRSDSRVVLDEMGADKLLGNGDMLFLYPGTSKIMRAQGTFVSDEEVTGITEYLCNQAPAQYSRELIELKSAASGSAGQTGSLEDRDELYEQAIDLVVREQRGSVSLLQRALGIGYGRGARLIDFMAEDGIVGAYNGSQAREVLYSLEEWEEAKRSRWGRAG